MKTIMDFDEYLKQNSLARISLGQSGAAVHRLRDGKIAKHVKRAQLSDEILWEKYRRESLFYSRFPAEEYSFVPQVYTNLLREDELLLVLREYRPLRQEELLESSVLGKVLDALVQIHALPVPDFATGQTPRAVHYSAESLAACREGWLQVLLEHPNKFSLAPLDRIQDHINRVNDRLFAPLLRFVHGDFHCQNLLARDHGRILVCDWQNCGSGEATGDLAFLLSRLSADGFPLDEDILLSEYCRRAKLNDPRQLQAQMRLASLNTAYLFWHEYLHGSSPERVGEIYHKMCADMDFLLELC
ncbi:MAG: hypothetical protein E7331_12315 [Clostridiales bacterium]|nr:hypothetical protein [Clostridiales bacterium]